MRGAANRRSVSKRTAQKWAAIAEGAPDLLPEANDDFAPSRAPRKREERETQRKIVSTLRKLLPHGSLVWATPNHARSPEHRFSLMQEGMVAGMPDLFILVRGKLYGLEVKRPIGGVVSRTQKYIHALLSAHAVPVCVVRSVQEAVAFLQAEGAL